MPKLILFIILILSPSLVQAQIMFGGRGGGGGGSVGLDSAFSTDNSISSATSARPLQWGDGVTDMCGYTDGTLGPVIKPCTDSNTRTYIWTNFTWCMFDVEGNSCMWTFDPDAATPNLMYQFTSGYRPKKSIWFGAGSLSTDGTQCAAPAEATPVASGVKLYTVICADNDSSRMHGSVVIPESWDAGTVTMTAYVVQTAADTNVIEYQTAMQCKGDTESLVATSSYGTEVVWTDTMSGSGKINMATSGAVTPSGTCSAGDFVSFYVDVGATNTTTAMATVHFIGFKLNYLAGSLSD